MFVITADQIKSRHSENAGAKVLAQLATKHLAYTLPPDQTSGDEIQFLTEDPHAVLETILHLTSTQAWRIGLGVGPVDTPTPSATRVATGNAFVAARHAVNRARQTPAQLAVEVKEDDAEYAESAATRSGRLEALMSLLIVIRRQRTQAGWQVIHLFEKGLNQKHTAKKLGISASAVSQRARSAHWQLEKTAKPALLSLITAIDPGGRKKKWKT